MTRIPVFVIGGYLGAGKTTFINECLLGGLHNAAIIVNDFGEINIDASIISAHHGDTLELTNGCVCCSIGTSLADTLFTILDRPQLPDLILIEASGVADPASVAAFTHLQGLVLAGILVMVDAVNALDTSRNALLSATFERQIRAAHIVALTKTDIADSRQSGDVRALVESLNPDAVLVATDAIELSQLVVDYPATPRATPLHSTTEAEASIHFTSHLHQFVNPPALSEVTNFLESLPPSVVRVKGVVALDDDTTVLIQKSGRYVSSTPTTLAPTGLVIISAE